MLQAFQIILGITALIFFVWLITPTKKSHAVQFIDPDDSYQIGMLAGLVGCSMPDAAVMRYALQRFQEMNGRRATTKDIGIVLGIIYSMK
jgi:hypothetical protein